jgi:LmbE family N-acetylglucosaminyl deacetylase
VRWLGFLDFGYSKTMAEALEYWGKDELLAEMDATLRAVDPDFVITNHDKKRGHGHHQASALALAYACEQQGLRTGRITPLYERAGGFGPPRAQAATATNGGEEKPRKPLFRFDPSAMDLLRGKSFAAQAHEGLLEHASQGPWGAYNPTRVRRESWQQVLPANEDFEKDRPPLEQVRSVFDEPAFLAGLQRAGQSLADLQADFAAFREDRPDAEHISRARRMLPMLRQVYDDLQGEGAEQARIRLQRRMNALERVLIAGAGITLETYLPDTRLPIGGQRSLRVALRGPAEKVIFECDGRTGKAVEERGVAAGWYELPMRAAENRGDSFLPEFTRTQTSRVRAEFELDGIPMAMERELILDLVQPIELRWDRKVIMVPARGGWERILSLEIAYHGDGQVSGPLSLALPPGLSAETIPARFELSSDQRLSRALVRLVSADENEDLGARMEIRAAFGDSQQAGLEVQPSPAKVSPELSVGLVRGPDDTIERFLDDMGVAFTVLDEMTLAEVDLGQFSTLLLDMRVYHHRPDLANHRDRMLRFCSAGGRVVVLYHKPGEWGPRPGKPQLAPFDLRTGRRRVAEEDAKVIITNPDHQIFREPHAIREADFDGWVQERLLNVPGEYDPAWTTFLSMHDENEEPLEGGLLYTDYGKGSYVFCSLALYRQLRRGHLGAARILLNLITP